MWSPNTLNGRNFCFFALMIELRHSLYRKIFGEIFSRELHHSRKTRKFIPATFSSLADSRKSVPKFRVFPIRKTSLWPKVFTRKLGITLQSQKALTKPYSTQVYIKLQRIFCCKFSRHPLTPTFSLNLTYFFISSLVTSV